MKLLIICQKVDSKDDNLSFFLNWIAEFVKHYKQITVICLFRGEYNLPDNVKVLSLGKERNSPIKNRYALRVMRYAHQIKYLINFYKYTWQERKNYDEVFVHMSQVYIILGGMFWKIWRKKIGLWYAHGSVPFSLKIAEKFTDYIFTSTKSGCRIESKKINVVGQGIDTNKLKAKSLKLKAQEGPFKIITVGRVSPVKDLETLISAIEILAKEIKNLKLEIIGGPGTAEHEKYLLELKEDVRRKNLTDIIEFVGPKPYHEVLSYFQKASLFINASHTGSLDKTLLEAMSFELPILSCNESLLEVLSAYSDRLMFEKKNYQELAEKIKIIYNLSPEERRKMGQDLRRIVEFDHSLEKLVKKIKNCYE